MAIYTTVLAEQAMSCNETATALTLLNEGKQVLDAMKDAFDVSSPLRAIIKLIAHVEDEHSNPKKKTDFEKMLEMLGLTPVTA